MFKNTSGQKLTVFAFDYTTGAPKTGDAANITAYVSKDDGAVTVLADTSATEKDATNAKGLYDFDLAQGETNANKLTFSGQSSTANIVIVAVPAVVYTLPPNFPAAAIDSNGKLQLQDGAIVAATFGAAAIDSAALAASAAAEIADAVWDEALAGHVSAGSAGLALGGTATAVAANLDAAISDVLAAIAALPTASENTTELFDQADGVETGKTLREAMRLILAALCGLISGLPGTTVTFRDTNDTKDRIVADVDGNGNRTSITLDAS